MSISLGSILFACAGVVLFLRFKRKRHAGALRTEHGAVVFPPPLALNAHYHLFLSHNWLCGQDQMRIVKERVQRLLPGALVFLDVDDLLKGRGKEYLDVSGTVLVFCTQGYFQSLNCMRELVRAVLKSKPIICMLEPEERHGRLTPEEILQQLRLAEARYDEWGLSEEVRQWHAEGLDPMPTADALYAALFAEDAVEWARIGHFQAVTLRLISERLLPVAAHGTTHLPSELHHQKVTLASPTLRGKKFHLYASPHNRGAEAFVGEVRDACESVLITCEQDDLPESERLLVYLNGETWTSGAESDAFAAEVARALALRVELLLVHEAPGVVGASELRSCVEFGDFFTTTPEPLLDAKIYDTIAIALKQARPWRVVSLALVVRDLAGCAGPTTSSLSSLASLDLGDAARTIWAISPARSPFRSPFRSRGRRRGFPKPRRNSWLLPWQQPNRATRSQSEDADTVQMSTRVEGYSYREHESARDEEDGTNLVAGG